MRKPRPLTLCFIVGATAIFALRTVLPALTGAVLAALCACGLVAWLGWHYWTNNHDSNRAGDDLYYLGLLFTLVSLIYALLNLFIFDSAGDLEERTYDLIGNFGIALFSTVAGILGRILLQGATTKAVEEPAPVPEPTTATNRELEELRRQIRGATDAFRHFTRVTTEQATENKSHVNRDVQQSIERMTAQAQAAIANVQTAWNQAVQQVQSNNTELAIQVDQELKSATTRASNAWLEIAHSAESASTRNRERLKELTREMTSMTEAMNAISRALAPMSQGLAAVTSEVKSLGATAVSATAELDAQAKDLVQAHIVLINRAQEGQKESLRAYQDAVLQFLRDANEEMAKEIANWKAVAKDLSALAEAQQRRSERDSKRVYRLFAEPIAGTNRRRPKVKRTFKRRLSRGRR